MSCACSGHSEKGHDEPSWQVLLISAVLCGIFAGLGFWLERAEGSHTWMLVAYVVAYAAGGWDAALDSWENVKKGRFDIHFLMVAVAVGSAAIGAWWEGCTLLFLFSLSNALEAMVEARTQREIQALFREAPTRATLVVNGEEREVAVEELRAEDVLRVLPGEPFPTDGEVLEGNSAADESSLTGESVAVEKRVGSEVFSGTLNTYGALVVRVTRAVGESSLAKLIRMIEEAQSSKAPMQRFTDRFGTGYTLLILGLSALMFAVWHWGLGIPAFYADEIHGKSALYRAMTLLVVCSPCALVISIPSSILTGIAVGARRGILFRGGVALENLATIDRIGMDKTGTLTTGEPRVCAVEVNRAGEEKEILRIAASLGQSTTHPLGRAIAREWHGKFAEKLEEISQSKVVAGQGVSGEMNGQRVQQGRRGWMPSETWLDGLALPEAGITEVLVWCESGLAGRILLQDELRKEARCVVKELAALGKETVMLTGDREESARLVAGELSLVEMHANLRPEEKLALIEQWKREGKRVAMVGDGVNDAPSLAAADVSIGMGLRGSGAALEQADVVLSKDNLVQLVDAVRLSRKCRAIIYQNLAISLGMVVLLAIAALGSWVPLPVGVLGHEGSTVLVVLNSLRLIWFREFSTCCADTREKG